jgi:TorA maturation chaperone TorD
MDHPEPSPQSQRITQAIAPPLNQEEQARADFYALCSRLLLHAPDADFLHALANADALDAEGDSPLGDAWENLVLAAAIIDADAAREEFDALFISIGTPQVNPYASVYLSGFMHEKPLARLRDDLAELGLGRTAGRGETEDHLAALCEAMRIMIASPDLALRRPLARQKAFFERHLAPWHARCLDDIRNASGANFYQRVADVIEAFLGIEAEAFEMAEDAVGA